MNDITWRSMEDDETWDLLVKFPNNGVLVETEFCFDICIADTIENNRRFGPYCTVLNEKVKRIAFFE